MSCRRELSRLPLAAAGICAKLKLTVVQSVLRKRRSGAPWSLPCSSVRTKIKADQVQPELRRQPSHGAPAISWDTAEMVQVKASVGPFHFSPAVCQPISIAGNTNWRTARRPPFDGESGRGWEPRKFPAGNTDHEQDELRALRRLRLMEWDIVSKNQQTVPPG